MIPGLSGIGGFVGGGDEDTTPSVEYLGDFSLTTNAKTFNITNVDFGEASSLRRMFMFVYWRASNESGSTFISSASIGGIAARIDRQTNNHNSGNGNTYGLGIISANIPTGTSGTVSITLSIDSFNGTVYVGSVRAIDVPASLFDSVQGHGSGAVSSFQDTISVPANGFHLAASGGYGGTVTQTSPLPLVEDQVFYDFAVLSNQPVNASKIVRCTITGSNSNCGVVAVTWAP